MFGLVTLVIIAIPSADLNEVGWCEKLAPKYNAKYEYVLWDRTRCDLVTDTEAIEVDWPHKWAEAIGQSQYYSIILDKKPAILLLVSDPIKERRFIYRCQIVCVKLGIKLYLEPVKRTED